MHQKLVQELAYGCSSILADFFDAEVFVHSNGVRVGRGFALGSGEAWSPKGNYGKVLFPADNLRIRTSP